MTRSTKTPVCLCDECQGDPTSKTAALHTQMKLFMNTLDEKQRRLFAGLEANRTGHGGQKVAAEILGMSQKTVRRGQRELKQAKIWPGIRRPGGGRKNGSKK